MKLGIPRVEPVPRDCEYLLSIMKIEKLFPP